AVCRCPVAGRGAAATRAAAAVAAAVDFIGFGDVQLEPREEDANDGEDERHEARPSVSQSSVIDEVVAGGFRCAACEFFLCDACSQPYQLPSSRASASSSGGDGGAADDGGDSAGEVKARQIAEASLRLGAQCKLQGANGKWLAAVVAETLPAEHKVRVHVPMEEVPDQVLDVTSPKLKP
ncbi:unnamed protein product, partial [Polarella glacialis]